MLFEPPFTGPLPRRGPATPVTGGEIPLAEFIILEHVEHARRGGNGRRFQHVLEILAQLGLRVQLLERAQLREHSVAILGPKLAAISDRDAGCHHQHFATQLPGVTERLRTLLDVFDHVQYVAEVHRIGRTRRYVWAMHRVPAVAVEAQPLETPNVVSMSAAVVKQRTASVQQVVPQDAF